MSWSSRRPRRPAIGSWGGGLVVRYLSERDLRTLDAVLPPDWNIGQPLGYAALRDGKLLGIGQVTHDECGRAWGWLNRASAIPATTMHRCAIEMLDRLRSVGEPALYMICDTSTPAAMRWAARLGFVPDDTMTHELGRVMRCDLST